ncbi:BTAD domain-containing putative transcriptional regulator [Kitasatospora sp. NPDC096147]|uniref:BTAD domain-containing putative transcriptional regulator n=1 Tax=Kitasatospora sp. NPDC096147 TaxID=3364093 RepID=UPI0038007B12
MERNAGAVRFRVLGALGAEVDGRPVRLGGPHQRAVLGQLLVADGAVVSADGLADGLWQGRPPAKASASLQAYVSNLRRLLEPARGPREPARLLVSEGPGYALRLPRSGALDARDFERLLVRARELRRPGPAREGLALWHGEVYGEFADRPWALREVARLGELRLSARELLIELELEQGDSAVAVPQALALTEDHPYREEGWRLLALALWAGHRQAEALDALRRARTLLGEELGLDPSPALADLEAAVLHQHTELLPPRARDRMTLNGLSEKGSPAESGGRPESSGGASAARARPADGGSGAGRVTVDGGRSAGAAGPGVHGVGPGPAGEGAAPRPAAVPGPAGGPSGPDGPVAGSFAVTGWTAPGDAGPAGWAGGAAEAVPPAAVPPGGPDDARELFVGREAELRAVRESAAEVAAGGLRVVLVSGEAGAGKSTLLHRLRVELTGAGWLVATGRCPETEGAPAAWAWTEALRALAARCAPSPALAGLLAPLLETEAPTDGPGREDALAGRFRLHRAVADWLRAATAARPVALVLDDLHAADRETRALLGELATGPAVPGLLLVLAHRPGEGELTDMLGQLARLSPRRLPLRGLAAADAGRLVEAVCAAPVRPETVAALAERTGGNPFYLRESARLLAAEGALVAVTEVPQGVADVLRRRFDRLPPATLEVLRLAAVVGREAEVDILLAATGPGPAADPIPGAGPGSPRPLPGLVTNAASALGPGAGPSRGPFELPGATADPPSGPVPPSVPAAVPVPDAASAPGLSSAPAGWPATGAAPLVLPGRVLDAASTLAPYPPQGSTPDAASAALHEEQLYAALESALDGGLLTEPGPGVVRFTHALVRDTLYGDLTRLRRSRLHARVAQAIRSRRPTQLSALAHHFAHSATSATAHLAVEYAVRAAEAAERRYAHETCAALYRQALDLLPLVPAELVDQQARRIELLGALLRAQVRAGAIRAALATRATAIAEARESGRFELAVAAWTSWTEPTPWVAHPYGTVDHAAVEALNALLARPDLPPATRCHLLDALTYELDCSGSPEGWDAAAEAVAIAREVGEPVLLAHALAAQARVHDYELQIELRTAIAEELSALATEHDLPAYRWLAEHLWCTAAAVRSDFAGVRAHALAGLRIAEAYHLPELVDVGRCQLGMLALIEGREEEADARFRAAIEGLYSRDSIHAEGFDALFRLTRAFQRGTLAEELPLIERGGQLYGPLVEDVRALALLEAGRPVAEVRATRVERRPIPPDYYRSFFLTLRALAVIALDERAEAAEVYADLLPHRGMIAGAASTSIALRPVPLTLAELADYLGEPGWAAGHRREAVELAARLPRRGAPLTG